METTVPNFTRYNRYVKNWEEWGINEYKNAKFSVKVGISTYTMNECTETFGENYPIREVCNRKGDPSDGCLTADAFHYRASVPYPKSDEVTIQVMNSESGTLVYNSTYKLRFEKAESWDTMDCNTPESCMALCQSWEGFGSEELKVCMYEAYLGNLCYRVHQSIGNDYEIDDPPDYELNNYFGGVGCK